MVDQINRAPTKKYEKKLKRIVHVITKYESIIVFSN